MNGQTTPDGATVPAFGGAHAPKPLSFDPGKLPGLSERLLRSHWENNYCGAVKALNAVERRLAAMLDDSDLPPYVYGDLKREELLRTGSVHLHELYFGNLGGDGKAADAIQRALAHAFGSFSRWEAEFRRTANALSGGSGWAILALGPEGALHDYWAWDHTSGAPGSQPLLVLDMCASPRTRRSRTLGSSSARARSWASSGRTARGRRRSSNAWRASFPRMGAR